MTINEMKLLALQAEWEAISKNTMGGKYDKAYQNGVHNVGRRIREMIDEFEQEEKNKLRKIGETSQEQMWIPVSERLPKLGERVLCQCRANIYEVLKLTVDGWYYNSNHCYMESFVIAWMPLPEPYVESEDKE